MMVNTKVAVTQVRMEGSKTEDEAKRPLATIVLRPHALYEGFFFFNVYKLILEGSVDKRHTDRAEENEKLLK